MKNIKSAFLLIVALITISCKGVAQETIKVKPNWKVDDKKKITTTIRINKVKSGVKLPEEKSTVTYEWLILSANDKGFKIKETAISENDFFKNLKANFNDPELIARMDDYIKKHPMPPAIYNISNEGLLLGIDNLPALKDFLIGLLNYSINKESVKINSENFPMSDEQLEMGFGKSTANILGIYGKEFSTNKPLIDTIFVNDNGSSNGIIQKWTCKKISKNIWNIGQDIDPNSMNNFDNPVKSQGIFLYNSDTTWPEKITFNISAKIDKNSEVKSVAEIKIE